MHTLSKREFSKKTFKRLLRNNKEDEAKDWHITCLWHYPIKNYDYCHCFRGYST